MLKIAAGWAGFMRTRCHAGCRPKRVSVAPSLSSAVGRCKKHTLPLPIGSSRCSPSGDHASSLIFVKWVTHLFTVHEPVLNCVQKRAARSVHKADRLVLVAHSQHIAAGVVRDINVGAGRIDRPDGGRRTQVPQAHRAVKAPRRQELGMRRMARERRYLVRVAR